jgi:predicted GIY-YIG superfamily endonuclease
VYLVRCADGTLYCGIAIDVEARLAAHARARGARYTRGRGPFELLVVRRVRTKGTALRLEYAIKQLTRREKLALAADAARLEPIVRRIARAGARSRVIA